MKQKNNNILPREFREILTKRFPSMDYFTIFTADKLRYPNSKISRKTWEIESVIPLKSHVINIEPTLD